MPAVLGVFRFAQIKLKRGTMSRIAVLFGARGMDPERYYIHHLAECWRKAGHEIVYLKGTRRFVPADLLLVHVNLSVVPAAYLRFADRYPKVLNRRITDIRKSQLSELRVGRNDPWSGPVIVKSDLNSGGRPEQAFRKSWLERRFSLLHRTRRAAERLLWQGDPCSGEYQVYPNLAEVPGDYFSSSRWVVERFVPEMEGGLYHLRMHQFLGDRYLSVRLASEHPLVKVANSCSIIDVEPHPAVECWRQTFGLDYGKLDYVVVDGEPVLLDINKTMGSHAGPRSDAEIRARHRYLAEGIKAYL